MGYSFSAVKRVLLAGLVLGLALGSGCTGNPGRLRLATTTSAYDSGILNALIPPFEKARQVRVEVVAVGSGQALALGRRGDADVLLVHDPEGEAKFMGEGWGAQRVSIMSNDFIIVGPKEDPAHIRGLNPVAALREIAKGGAPFVSRGDDSGTHAREKQLWKEAQGEPPPKEGWYLSAGQGMAETLMLAEQKGAYTLTDRSTFVTLRSQLHLEILVEKDERLANVYSVILLNPRRLPNLNHRLATQFKEYLTSQDALKIIASFGTERYGQPLFIPIKGG